LGCGNVLGENQIFSFQDEQPLPCYRVALSANGPSTYFNLPPSVIPSPTFPGAFSCGPTFQSTNAALQPLSSLIVQLQSNETCDHCLYDLNSVDSDCSVLAYRITIIANSVIPNVIIRRNGDIKASAPLSCPPNLQEFTYMWFGWEDGLIAFGCGGTVGEKTQCSFNDPNPQEVRSVALKTDTHWSTAVLPTYCLPKGQQNSQD
jgi:hypothetical protein